MKMTLARALRWKKRVVSTIRKFESDILANNSRIKGKEVEVAVSDLLVKRQDWITHLINLKMALTRASAPIQQMILTLAEAKAEIVFLSQISTTHGVVRSGYRDEAPLEYEAVLRKSAVDAKVAALQQEIDEIQTNIDGFNNANYIDVEVPVEPPAMPC